MKSQHRPKIRFQLALRDGAVCFYCGRSFDKLSELLDEATLDHWIPQALGGGSDQENLRLACEPCNAAKADRLPWVVALTLLQLVRDDESWWRACMPASAVQYRAVFEEEPKPQPKRIVRRAWARRPSWNALPFNYETAA